MTALTRVRRLVLGLTAVATAVSLSACGAGRDAHTYGQRVSAEASSASAGQLALRNVAIQAPAAAEAYEVGGNATVSLTVTSRSPEPDRLVEVTSSAAREVVVLAGGQEGELVVPPRGSTGDFVTLELRGLTRPLRPAEYVDLSFRFADNGSVQVLTPVAGTGESDRPIYTGERLENGHEPALQAPAGGDHGGEDETHGGS